MLRTVALLLSAACAQAFMVAPSAHSPLRSRGMATSLAVKGMLKVGRCLGQGRAGPARVNSFGLSLKMMGDDDTVDKSIEAVDWISNPALLQECEPEGTGSVMPLFPLGGYVYLPNSEHRLNIFEPRYRALYNDILFSGSRRFAVCTVNPTTGEFSRYCSVLYLKELKEVSEQTGDAVKFVCDHEVIGRVKIERILNPSVWKSAETYLKVEATPVEDTVLDEEVARQKEIALEADYCELVELQHELGEDVKFTKGSIANFKTAAGKDIWQTIRMWQNFQEQKLVSKQAAMQQEFQEKLIQYLIKSSGSSKIPEVINISDLPDDLKLEVKNLQQRMAEDLAPVEEEYNKSMQLMMQAESQERLLDLLSRLIKIEKGFLDTKNQLKAMFKGLGDDEE